MKIFTKNQLYKISVSRFTASKSTKFSTTVLLRLQSADWWHSMLYQLLVHKHLCRLFIEQECPSVEGKLPAYFDVVDCCDLGPLTFISELDLDMVVTYLHAKN